MTTAILIIVGTVVYLVLGIPMLLRLAGSNARLRAQRDADLDERLRAHGAPLEAHRPRRHCTQIPPKAMPLDDYELTDKHAHACDMETLR